MTDVKNTLGFRFITLLICALILNLAWYFPVSAKQDITEQLMLLNHIADEVDEYNGEPLMNYQSDLPVSTPEQQEKDSEDKESGNEEIVSSISWEDMNFFFNPDQLFHHYRTFIPTTYQTVSTPPPEYFFPFQG